MLRGLLLASLLLLATTACSTVRRELDSNPPFAPHYFRYHDVEVNWQVERSYELLRLAGTVTNRRDAYLRDLELTVRVVDGMGRPLARASFTDFPTYLPPGKTETFRMDLRPPPGAMPAWFRFTYIYWLAEEPPAFAGNEDVPHFGHFDSAP